VVAVAFVELIIIFVLRLFFLCCGGESSKNKYIHWEERSLDPRFKSIHNPLSRWLVNGKWYSNNRRLPCVTNGARSTWSRAFSNLLCWWPTRRPWW